MEDGIRAEKSAGRRVAFFSLEMSADQLATRILAEQSGISSENLRMGKISQQDFRNLAAPPRISKACRSISTTRPASPSPRFAPAPADEAAEGIGFIVVDYLQLLQGTGKGGNDNRVQEISEISAGSRRSPRS
jgi:replicative DNA helicase